MFLFIWGISKETFDRILTKSLRLWRIIKKKNSWGIYGDRIHVNLNLESGANVFWLKPLNEGALNWNRPIICEDLFSLLFSWLTIQSRTLGWKLLLEILCLDYGNGHELRYFCHIYTVYCQKRLKINFVLGFLWLNSNWSLPVAMEYGYDTSFSPFYLDHISSLKKFQVCWLLRTSVISWG